MKPLRPLSILIRLVALLAAGLSFHPPARASQLVALDDAGGALPGGISTMELYDGGLYWSVYGGVCGGEFSTLPSAAVLGSRFPSVPPERYAVLGCALTPTVGGMVRDDAYVYFTTPSGVGRKQLSAAAADNHALVGPAWNALIPGAMMVHNGRGYHAYSSNGGQISGQGYFGIGYFTLPGQGGAFAPVTLVSHGNGLPNVGRITRMGVMSRRPPGTIQQSVWGIALTTGGYLLRFPLDPPGGTAVSATILRTGVTDFAVRREEFLDAPPRFNFFQDTLYASVGDSKCPADPPSRLINLDPVSGETFTLYTAVDGYISAIGQDADYLFVCTFGRQEGGGICQLAGSGNIRSKRLISSLTDPGGVDPNWGAIEPNASGANLRSDGRHLYFTRGKEVRRLPNNTPPAVHDFAAIGLEAVQVVQDLNNSVRLVEGKRTVVRGYARVLSSNLAAPEWQPNALLRGFLDGVELPGSPLHALNSARVTRSGDFEVLRPDAARSFQFELPASWVRRGRLTLSFTVNPNLALYESGSTPLANNTWEAADLEVVQVPAPCWAWASMHSTTAPNYWPWENADDFARILERAKSMLPVADIHLHPTTERVSDEQVCFRTCDGPLGLPVPCGFVCNEPFDFADSNAWSEAMLELQDHDLFDQTRPGCRRAHYVGAIHPAVQNAFWGGLGQRPGFHFLSVMWRDLGGPVNTPYGGTVLAHEFGHNLGRRHVNQRDTTTGGCGGSAPLNPDLDYPHDGCSISTNVLSHPSSAMGFDVVTFRPIRPNAAGDLMSYADVTWPSTYTYNAMLDALGPVAPGVAPRPAPAGGNPPAGPYLLVRGLLDVKRAQVRLKPCYSVPEGVVDPAKVQESIKAAVRQPDYGYVLRKLNAAGTVLEEVSLVLNLIEDGDGREIVLSQFITKPAGMTSLQVLKDGVVLAQSAASPNAPAITGLQAAYDAASASVRVSFNASDLDGDPLRFTAQFSPDGGGTWRTLRVNAGSTAFSVPARFLPGGTQCRVRIIASDGFHSSVAISSIAFSLARRAPEPFIGGVRAGQRLPHGSTASLLGFALDAEDGSLPAAALAWSVAGPTPNSGTGASFSLAGLSPGSYTATLTAIDSDNATATRVLAFEILPLVVPEGMAPVVDGDAADEAYAGAALVRWPLSGRASARLVHSGSDLYVAFTDLPYASGGGPAVAGLRVDVNASGDATAQAGDVGFFVDDAGIPWQMAGNGSTLQPLASPVTGFKAVIVRGSSGWSAELRIPDSLVGGWNHAVRLLLENRHLAVDDPAVTVWPRAAGRDAPATWARAWFGVQPPAPTNRPPVARPEMPATLSVQGTATVQLNGTASFDPDGTPLGFQWTQVSGPAVTLSGAALSTPSFNFAASQATAFRFRLVVNDGQFNSTPAEVAFTLIPESSPSIALPPSVTRTPSGLVQVALRWPGRAGDPVVVQASTNLVQWQNMATNTVGSLHTVVHAEAQTGQFPRRYFRLASAPEPPPGTGLQVLNLNDSGEGSLRQVLSLAPAGSTITFAPGVLGTLRLTSGELSLQRSVHIRGPGAGWLAISGNNNGRLFHVRAGPVTLSGLTLRDGLVRGATGGGDAAGGAVLNGAVLTLVRCELTGNLAQGDDGLTVSGGTATAGGRGLGGGIYNTGTLVLVQCTLEGNEARGGHGGRGADRDNGNAGYTGGTGGAALGGAIYNGGVLGLTNCTFGGNRVLGGTGGTGGEGGLFQGPGGRGGNAEGAGLFNEGSSALFHATVAGGMAERGPGGGGVPAGTAGIAYGGGLRSVAGSLRLGNTLAARNTLGPAGGTANGPDVSGPVLAQGHCLVGITNGSTGWLASDRAGLSTLPLDPLLGPLLDYGGPTRCFVLLPGSPAIDQGRSFGSLLDQRGLPRPFDSAAHPNAAGGDGSDIGSLELDAADF